MREFCIFKDDFNYDEEIRVINLYRENHPNKFY